MTVKERGKNLLDKVVGDVVSPIVECLDVDGVARRIDVNDVAQRIDINELVSKIDVNALLEKVDINALIDRSDLAAIVAQSSSGVFTGVMDNLRFQIVRVDLILLQIFQFGKQILPPAPGMIDQHTPFPKKTTQKAIAVQLHYCGIFSKSIAIGTDAALLFVVQTLFTLLIEAALKRVNDLFLHLSFNKETTEQDEFLMASFLNAISSFCYFWIAIALTGQTIGMAFVGIRVVNTNGDKDVSFTRSALRTALLVVTIFMWPIAMLVGVARRDGRMPHDIVAHTGVIFKWNARMARLRETNVLDDSDGSSTMSGQDRMNAQQGSVVDEVSGGSNASESPPDEQTKGSVPKNAAGNNADKGVSDSNNGTESRHEKLNAVDAGKVQSDIVPSSSAKHPVSKLPSATVNNKSALGAKRTTSNALAVPRTITLSQESLGDSENASLSVTASQSSKLRQVLDEGRKDLHNAKPPGVVGFFFKPVRTLVLEPSLAVAAAVVPPFVSAVPFADAIAATGVRIPFAAAKIGYGLLPYRDDADQAVREDACAVDLSLVAQNAILRTTGAGASEAAPQDLTATDSLDNLIEVSRSLGITVDGELEASRFEGRLFEDMKILHKIQQECDQRATLRTYPQSQIQEAISEGSRMVKFATAAYTAGMVQCDFNEETSVQELDDTKSIIAKHTGIDDNDIKLICMNGVSANVKLLRHFVAIDRQSNSVVLSISGSSFVVDTKIDADGGVTDFCSGRAHKGLSEIASNIWNVSGGIIEKLLSQLESGNEESPRWSLIITGHSEGAGAGALLNIKCQAEELLGSHQVKFYGFASPPVFNLDDRTRDPAMTTALQKAFAHSICYINEDDCVPFLSKRSYARLDAQIRTVDGACKRLWSRDKAALANGQTRIPQVLVHDVTQVDPPNASVSKESLKIPASKVVWARRDPSGYGFNAIGCLPDDLATLDILLSPEMISNHLPSEYEDSLEALASSR